MSMSAVQRLAAQVYSEVANGHNLQDVLASLRNNHPDLSAQDNGMLQDIAYGCQRFRGSLEFMLSTMLSKPISNQALHALLIVALYQLQHSHNAPHAVVNEAVNNIARINGGRFRSLANALLRRFQRERTTLEAQCSRNTTARYNYPKWWVDYLRKHYPQYWHNILTATQAHPPMVLRINRRHTNADTYLTQLNAANIAAKRLDDYAIELTEALPVQALPGFSDGLVSVQDFGAQQAAYLLAPQDGERILDACAAPGGKSGHILELANCHLTALDIDKTRLARVESNLGRLNLQAEALYAADAADLSAWYSGKPFDAVLADVPCTASGVVRRNPDIKWLRRSTDAAKTAAQQVALLDALWQTVAPKGRMLLATCSIFHEENHSQLLNFLSRHPDAELVTEQTLLPNKHQDGFYYALIRKQ